MERRAETALLAPFADRIVALCRRTNPARAVLVGLSGIDASGKGFLAARLESRLRKAALSVALIGVDGWLKLPHVRFSTIEPGRYCYERGLRFAEMFEQLVLPLRDQRSIHLEMDYAEETARQYRRHRYELRGVEVVLLEGIFIFKR